MNDRKLGLLGCLAFFILCGCVNGQENKPTIGSLGWIAGCWEMSIPQRQMTISEHWMKPSGGMLIGMSRTVRGEKARGFEFLRIVSSDAGIEYISKPSQNKEETAFKLVRMSSAEAVFENLGHDFPQRIIYRLESPDSLHARIEGERNGKLSGIDFPMKRTKCD